MTETAPAPRLWWLSLRSGLRTFVLLGLVGAVAAFAVLALTGHAIRLPPAIVERVEARLTAGLPARMAVDLDGVEVEVDDDWTPRLRLTGARLMQDGKAIVSLPEAAAVFDAGAFSSGRLVPVDVRLTGATLALVRGEDGRIDIALGAGAGVADLATARAALRQALDGPALASLRAVRIDRLALSLTDRRSGRVWQVEDGTLSVATTAEAVTAELAAGLEGAALHLVVTAARDSDALQLRVAVSGVSAADLAAQVPALAALSVIDAQVSGEITGSLGADGRPGPLHARLTLGPGSLRPSPGAAPLPFDSAALDVAYDPATARATLRRGALQSPTLRAELTGHADLLDAAGAPVRAATWPEQIVVQLALRDAAFDPEGQFRAPLTFAEGAVDLRLRLDPFAIDLGQVSLTGDAMRLTGNGRVTADARGWTTALDLAVAEVEADDLLRVWPLGLVPRTREWFESNVLTGRLKDLRTAIRLAPAAAPVVALHYEFAGATVQVLRTIPPVTGARGRATLEGQTYVIVLDAGMVTPPEGGAIDVAGSTFRIADVTRRPNRADLRLVSESSLTATLSLLDMPPFRFLEKAGRAVDIGEGRARLVTELSLPLQPRVRLADVTYRVAGEITGFATDRIVPGRTVTADRLSLAADPAGMTVGGAGRIADLPFDVTWRQPFGRAEGGASSIEGTVTLSDAGLASIGVALPDGMLAGRTESRVEIALPRGAPATLRLTGDLAGADLRLPGLGFRQKGAGSLDLRATLSNPARVDRMELDLPGLGLSGAITMAPGGGLAEAAFDRMAVGEWLDATAAITPAGARLTGGTLDLRRLPGGQDAGDGRPFGMTLDRLRVTDTITLDGFRGDFSPRGGLSGRFRATVNGTAAVEGTVVPIAGASAVRIRSDDAGAVLAAAGVFQAARGGALDLTLVPQAGRGVYDGRATISNVRVRNASVLAALLNAISVIGLLEQLYGTGIVFSDVDVDFRLTPDAVEITRGAAIGASLGVSIAGVYDPGTGQMDVQGVISPVYLLNGFGAIFSRAGEGLFGFNYRLTGPAASPAIAVNPLSILTPGMFREIFRRAPPTIAGSG